MGKAWMRDGAPGGPDAMWSDGLGPVSSEERQGLLRGEQGYSVHRGLSQFERIDRSLVPQVQGDTRWTCGMFPWLGLGLGLGLGGFEHNGNSRGVGVGQYTGRTHLRRFQRTIALDSSPTREYSPEQALTDADAHVLFRMRCARIDDVREKADDAAAAVGCALLTPTASGSIRAPPAISSRIKASSFSGPWPCGYDLQTRIHALPSLDRDHAHVIETTSSKPACKRDVANLGHLQLQQLKNVRC
ncbi:hypothetical protein AXG93_872s1190 [Marchantia polymorpha subsp. ruderalis]|uniref:Uncharacterized protein n=1 Tax=Marchantia polymorpha subsp. ruderalis TaxID=1480154 RepID=A0A176VJU3_MARPO|nr:hypothetical protein AXG93_872s1190 [Marchantia polymorpha subsp. ruderalis]